MAISFADDDDDADASEAPSMNTTPLIDVLLVLLVMLIITIPIRLHAVGMDLPAGAPPPDAPLPTVLRVDVTAANTWLWNGEALDSAQALETRMQALAREAAQSEVHVHPHPKAKYDAVIAVLSAAQRQGLQKFGVVDTPTTEGAPGL